MLFIEVMIEEPFWKRLRKYSSTSEIDCGLALLATFLKLIWGDHLFFTCVYAAEDSARSVCLEQQETARSLFLQTSKLYGWALCITVEMQTIYLWLKENVYV